MELDGCICADTAMEMYVLCKLSDCKNAFLYGLFFVKKWNFVKEPITHLNMSSKREHRK